MFKRVLMIGLLAISVLGTDAFAGSISKWGYSITGSAITANIDLSGAANPATKPSITIVDAVLDQIEYLCRNPNNFTVAPGSAGQRTVSGLDVLDSGNLVGKGQAIATVTFNIPGPFTCVNPNWTFLPESEAAKQITTTISWFACTGDAKTDPDPCFDGNTLTIAAQPLDKVKGVCTLNPVLRNSDGTVVLGQVYPCVETSP